MLAVRTTDDWTGATWTMECGGDTHTYTPAASVRSVVDYLDGWAAWVGTQIWGALAPVATWTWRGASTSAGLSAQPDFGVSLTEDWELSAQSADASNWLCVDLDVIGAGVVHWSTLAGARRGCYAPARTGLLALRADLRWSGDDGDASGVGAVCVGTQGTAGRAPVLETVATASESLALRDALALARSPRVVHVWDSRRSTWRLLALGEVQSADPRGTLTRIGLSTMGDVT